MSHLKVRNLHAKACLQRCEVLHASPGHTRSSSLPRIIEMIIKRGLDQDNPSLIVFDEHLMCIVVILNFLICSLENLLKKAIEAQFASPP